MSENFSDTDKPTKRGHWSKEEHYRFIQGIQMYGKNWKKIYKCVGTRSSNQIRSHAQKYFQKFDKKNKQSNDNTDLSKEAYLIFLRTLSCNAYLKFMFELQKMYSCTVPIEVLDSGNIIKNDETYPEDKLIKYIKISQ
ncbi:hypothetical protein SteCoe_31569 [Stentor coeruleus]|uniref:Uncharacterized protein n=1 Tax=Stentor coeruleus TaxID=5963 RepID=A0A1R2B108_9CILI|nr:hypothetical protein SteCoe_31569 [Stentor coeruleus]